MPPEPAPAPPPPIELRPSAPANLPGRDGFSARPWRWQNTTEAARRRRWCSTSAARSSRRSRWALVDRSSYHRRAAGHLHVRGARRERLRRERTVEPGDPELPRARWHRCPAGTGRRRLQRRPVTPTSLAAQRRRHRRSRCTWQPAPSSACSSRVDVTGGFVGSFTARRRRARRRRAARYVLRVRAGRQRLWVERPDAAHHRPLFGRTAHGTHTRSGTSSISDAERTARRARPHRRGAGAVAHVLRTRAAGAATTFADYKALVCIYLSGGNDSNNLIVPVDNVRYPPYQTARGNLALTGTKLLDADRRRAATIRMRSTTASPN